MKANEFVKMFGIEKTSSELSLFQSRLVMWSDWEFVEELKRLVESHETIELFGGLEKAMDIVINQEANGLKFDSLARAIADVESCQ